MGQAKRGDTVKVHYTGKFEDGTVFDTSDGREPLQFKIGEGKVILGFEEAVVGMSPGESKEAEIAVDKAYGPYQDEMLQVVERNQFPPDLNPEVGQHLQLHQPDGRIVVVTVKETSDSNVTLDANHPLAGKNLAFEIKLVEIV